METYSHQTPRFAPAAEMWPRFANFHSHTPFWFPVAMGAIIWTTYYLRSPNLRPLFLSPPTR